MRRQPFALVALLAAAVLPACASDVAAPPPPRSKPVWQAKLNAYSIASVARRDGRSDWNEVTQGNRIVLPREVYDYLVDRGVPYDKFQLLNPASRKLRLFTGPLDFCAPSGECYLPSWVMRQLGLKAGEPCAVATACFPDCAFVKFQPHTSDFLDISDHYVVLTRTLENMGGLTMGASVRVSDGKRTYTLDVLEVRGKPGSSVRDDSNGRAVAIGLMECPIEFAEPKDLIKPKKAGAAAGEAEAAAEGGDAEDTAAAGDSDAPASAEGESSSSSGGSSSSRRGARASSSRRASRASAAASPEEEETDPDRWTSGPEASAERVRALEAWGPIVPTGWEPDKRPPTPKFVRRREAEARGEALEDVASPFAGKARSLGGADADAEPKSEVAKARAAAKAAKQAKEAEAEAAAAAEAAAVATPSNPALALAVQLLALLRAVIGMIVGLVRGILTPSDVSFD